MGLNRKAINNMEKEKFSTVLIYDVYFKDYAKRQTEKIGILAERRSNPLRQDGLKWARKLFGKMVRDVHSIFILPREMEVRVD